MVGEAEAQVQVRRSSAKWSAIMSTGCPVGGHLLYNGVHDHENGGLKVGENLSLVCATHWWTGLLPVTDRATSGKPLDITLGHYPWTEGATINAHLGSHSREQAPKNTTK